MFVIDYASRNTTETYVDSISAIASEILKPEYVATGDAAQWADNAPDAIAAAQRGDYGDDDLEFLAFVLEDGMGYLYDATGLHAIEPGDGLYFVSEDDLAEMDI